MASAVGVESRAVGCGEAKRGSLLRELAPCEALRSQPSSFGASCTLPPSLDTPRSVTARVALGSAHGLALAGNAVCAQAGVAGRLTRPPPPREALLGSGGS
eukprot:scaffold17017_cov79-Isochrysis_galbana.AAC.4